MKNRGPLVVRNNLAGDLLPSYDITGSQRHTWMLDTKYICLVVHLFNYSFLICIVCLLFFFLACIFLILTYLILIIGSRTSGGTTGVPTVRRTGAHGPRGPIQAPHH